MTKKEYPWLEGAILDDHTKKKHSILSEYLRRYLITRCQLPQMDKFRVAIIDGFSGGGLYKCGGFGSPLIFADVLVKTTNEINISRTSSGMKPIHIECLLVLNDSEIEVIELLKENISPFLAAIKEECKSLHIQPEFFNEPFDQAYPKIKQRLLTARCSNVFFNLDQCGYSHATSDIIRNIMSSWKSSEVLLTFMIESLLTYLSPRSLNSNITLEKEVRTRIELLDKNENQFSKKEWLAQVEKIVYDHLKGCATYVSPFSINNPDGWRYWLMHFASNYRARQVYNNVLHQNGEAQAHFGRAGLRMLAYDPREEGQLYLFNTDSRVLAKEALYDDIPRFIAEAGDALSVYDFYAAAYSETPAHSDDIHEIIIENPDLEVITDSGGVRKKSTTIKPTDTLKLRNQRSLIFLFPE
jgi:three-Cys-motif partner protein